MISFFRVNLNDKLGIKELFRDRALVTRHTCGHKRKLFSHTKRAFSDQLLDTWPGEDFYKNICVALGANLNLRK